MRSMWMWVVVLGLAVAAFLALGGLDLLDGHLGETGDGASEREDEALEGLDGASAVAEGERAQRDAARGPALFTSGQLRLGMGGLRGMVRDATSQKPAAGVRVRLHGTSRERATVELSATSDASGGFAFPEVPASSGIRLSVGVGRPDVRSLHVAAIEPGEVNDVGAVWLGAPATVRGVVTDVGGAPLPGAEVLAFERMPADEEMFRRMHDLFAKIDQEPEALVRATTNAKGAFELAGVPPGLGTVVARQAGYQHVVREVVVAAEGLVGKEIHFRLPQATFIEGDVVDVDGQGIAGARVAILATVQLSGWALARRFATTDRAGRFRIEAPGGGSRLGAIAAAEGYATRLAAKLAAPGERQRFVLQRGAEVRLRFVDAAGSTPVEGASVLAMIDAKDNGGSIASHVTDARGEVAFVASVGKVQALLFKHPEYGSRIGSPQAGAAISAGLTLPEDFEFKAGANRFTITVDATRWVSGVVLDGAGRPLAGATVSTPGLMGTTGTVLSDSDGRFRLPFMRLPMSGAKGLVIAKLPGYVQKGDTGGFSAEEGVDAAEAEVVLERAVAVRGRIVDQDRRPVVGAEVRPPSTSRGMFIGGGSSAVVLTDADGRFVVEGQQAEAEISLSIRHAGFAPHKVDDIKLPTEGTGQTKDIVLSRGVRLTVNVTDPHGEVVQGVRLVATRKDEASERFRGGETRHSTDGGGVVRLERLAAPQKLVLVATKDGLAPAYGAVELTEDAKDAASITLALREMWPIRGRILGEGGVPLEEVSVVLMGAQLEGEEGDDGIPMAAGISMLEDESKEPTWMWREAMATKGDGTFAFSGYGSERIQLRLTLEGYRSLTREITSRRDTIELSLARIDPVILERLKVLRARRDELREKMVEAMREDGFEAMAPFQEEIDVLDDQISELEGDG